MPEENTSNKSVVLLMLAVIVLVGIIYFAMKSSSPSESENGEQTPQFTKENVEIKEVDLVSAKSDGERLPEGFPSSIPLEVKNIIKSTKATYPDRSVASYTIEYKSDKTVSSKYNEYLNFMQSSGYEFTPDGKNEEAHSLYGKKGRNDLLIVVLDTGQGTMVQVNYLERII